MTYSLPSGGSPTFVRSDLMCKISEVRTQSPGYPRLLVTPGTMVALRYKENGHITKPTAEKLSTGAVSVYGTAFPLPSDTLAHVHHVWNANGTGGDGRGRLLGRTSFDDGSCHEANDSSLSKLRQQKPQPPHDSIDGPSLLCWTSVPLPDNLTPGSLYTLYWVWDWPSADLTTNSILKQEVYTSCIDLDVSD